MARNSAGCSGGMDAFARWWNRVVRRAGSGRPLAFTGCCAEHDLFYEQGGSRADRAFADAVLRRCIAENLMARHRPLWVRLHVPFCFWLAVRIFGGFYWSSSSPAAMVVRKKKDDDEQSE